MKSKKINTKFKVFLFICIVIIITVSILLIKKLFIDSDIDNSNVSTTTIEEVTSTTVTTTIETTTTTTTTKKKTTTRNPNTTKKTTVRNTTTKTSKTPENVALALNIDINDPNFNKISKLNISAIGDSVMLGAVPNLNSLFTNGSFDGKVSRQIWQAPKIIESLKQNNKLGNPVIIALGTNSDAFSSYKGKIMKLLEGREVFWVTVNYSKTLSINAKLVAAQSEYTNFHVIDWNKCSSGHSEYFYKDGIHLTGAGRKAYTACIYNYLYEFYKE